MSTEDGMWLVAMYEWSHNLYWGGWELAGRDALCLSRCSSSLHLHLAAICLGY